MSSSEPLPCFRGLSCKPLSNAATTSKRDFVCSGVHGEPGRHPFRFCFHSEAGTEPQDAMFNCDDFGLHDAIGVLAFAFTKERCDPVSNAPPK